MKATIFLFFILFQSCVGFSQSYEGQWAGDLRFGGTTLPFVLNILHQEGKWSVTADSPKEGAKGIPGKMELRGDSLSVQLQGGIHVQGVLLGMDTIKAEFFQSGVKLPFLLIRQNSSGQPIEKLNRPQTPQPPYSYDTLDVRFKNDYDDIVLGGTLTFPKKAGKYPAVVLLTGSGPQDRNEELFGHQTFKVIADYLTRQGIVVFRYDDRGVGESGGVFETGTIEDFSKDAIAAFKFLKKQKQVDIHKLGFLGHSEGGLIAQLLAGQSLPDLSFIISLAGPAISIDKLLVEQLYAIGKAGGMSAFNLEIAKQINIKNFEVVKGPLNTEDAYNALMKNMGITTANERNAPLRKELMTMLAPAYRYFVRIEPEKYLPKITIPMFATFGGLDVQVPPDSNLKSLFDLLPKNTKTVLKEYEGLNHLFQHAKTGQVSEYAHIEETISEVVLKDITNWINKL